MWLLSVLNRVCLYVIKYYPITTHSANSDDCDTSVQSVCGCYSRITSTQSPSFFQRGWFFCWLLVHENEDNMISGNVAKYLSVDTAWHLRRLKSSETSCKNPKSRRCHIDVLWHSDFSVLAYITIQIITVNTAKFWSLLKQHVSTHVSHLQGKYMQQRLKTAVNTDIPSKFATLLHYVLKLLKSN
jgi:hypothetical protein